MLGIMEGIVYLPLHGGHTPPKLFRYMVSLTRPLLRYMVEELGEEEVLRRFSNPFFFQAFSCVIGFDWHSSGTTTVLTGVLSKALENLDINIHIVGGKGRYARSIPEQLEKYDVDKDKILEKSRIAAKTDTLLLQDGYDIYHHAIMFIDEDRWIVIQQGMNTQIKYARRYHWSWDKKIDAKYLNEPHISIIASRFENGILNLTDGKSLNAKKAMLDIIRDGSLKRDLHRLIDRSRHGLSRWISGAGDEPLYEVPKDIVILPRKIDWDKVREIYMDKPSNYSELIQYKGFTKPVVRALALVSNLIYGEEVEWRDTTKYTFVVGGKDGVPYPIDYKTYKTLIEFFEDIVNNSKINEREKRKMLRRLHKSVRI